MAVVSISRIQVRRGRKNQGTGLPQLASGEIAWAIDAQELYIGNGAVSEGAPFVGNTKILTENDNLLEYTNGYEYRLDDAFIQTGSSISSPTVRSILARLDDRVSVRAFGVTGDGSDQTVELQRAIYQLYLNAVTVGTSQSRIVLHIEAGSYVISSTIYLPPFVTIRGAGVDKTIIRMTGTGPAFTTVSSLSTSSNPIDTAPTMSYEQQARNIEVSGLTLSLDNNRGFDLSSCRNSVFRDIKITGNFSIDTFYNPLASGVFYGILLRSKSSTVTSRNNLFDNVTIEHVPFAVYSDYDVIENVWQNCNFDTHYIGFAFGTDLVLGSVGQVTGPSHNTIKNNCFGNIQHQAIYVVNGTKNRSFENKFFSTGNSGNDEDASEFAIIEFTSIGNTTENDWFERTTKLMYDPNYLLGIPYIPEIKAPNIHEDKYTHVLTMGLITDPTRLFKLSADKSKAYDIEYYFDSLSFNAKRSGTLTIITDPSVNSINIVDDYSYLGNSAYSEAIDFTARNDNMDAANSVDTISVLVLNSINDPDAKLYYRVKTKT